MELSASEIIDRIGGTTAVAVLCGISPQAVSQWRKSRIPPAWRRFLLVVRADLFSDEVDSTTCEREAA